MNPIVISRSTASRCSTARRRVAKSLLILPVIACVLLCASCQDQTPPIVDTVPLGEGLKVIAYALVGASVLGVLGKIVK